MTHMAPSTPPIRPDEARESSDDWKIFIQRVRTAREHAAHGALTPAPDVGRLADDLGV
jgi:hypothetical protein